MQGWFDTKFSSMLNSKFRHRLMTDGVLYTLVELLETIHSNIYMKTPEIIVTCLDIKETPFCSTYQYLKIYNPFLTLFVPSPTQPINLCARGTHSCYQASLFLFLIVIQNCN